MEGGWQPATQQRGIRSPKPWKSEPGPSRPMGQPPFEVHWQTLIGCFWASKCELRVPWRHKRQPIGTALMFRPQPGRDPTCAQAGRRFWRFTFREDDMRTKSSHTPSSFPAMQGTQPAPSKAKRGSPSVEGGLQPATQQLARDQISQTMEK